MKKHDDAIKSNLGNLSMISSEDISKYSDILCNVSEEDLTNCLSTDKVKKAPKRKKIYVKLPEICNIEEFQYDNEKAYFFRELIFGELQNKKAWEEFTGKIILDFSDVQKISSRFINSIIAYQLCYIKREDFLKKVVFKNLSFTKKIMIDIEFENIEALEKFYMVSRDRMDTSDSAFLFRRPNCRGFTFDINVAGVFLEVKDRKAKVFDNNSDIPVSAGEINISGINCVMNNSDIVKIISNTKQNRDVFKIGEIKQAESMFNLFEFLTFDDFIKKHQKNKEIIKKIKKIGRR